MADCNRVTTAVAARELGLAFEFIQGSFEPDSILGLLSDLGFTFPPSVLGDGNFVTKLGDAFTAIGRMPELAGNIEEAFDEGLVAVLTATSDLLDQVVIVIDAVETTGTALEAAATASGDLDPAAVAAFIADLANRLLDYLVISYLEAEFPRLLEFLKLLGVAEVKAERLESTDPSQPPYFARRLHFDRIPQLLTDPQQFMRSEYRWGEADFDGELLLSRVSDLLFAFTVPHDFKKATATRPSSLRVFLFELRAKLDVDPKGYEANLAFSLEQPFTLKFPFVIEDWFIEVSAEGALDEGLSAIIQPPGTLSLVPPTGVLDGTLALTVVAERPPTKPPFAVFSLPLGCILARRASAGVGVSYDWDGSQAIGEPVIEFKVEDGEFLISGGSDRDGFLSSILPSNGASFLFDFGVGWSQSRGVFFSGGGGLETTLAIHRSIGPLRVDTLRVRLKLEGDEIELSAGVVAAVQLGPVTAVVDSIAFGAALALHRGNLGPLDLRPKLIPPNGVGIVVEAGGVRGGGFLYFFFEEGRYAGALELSVFSVAVKAFGLIDTKLPDGSPGFSFVIVIVAEFTPIQLGFGFTLLGVGGLLGVNRSMDSTALQDAVRSGSLEHLLFPRNPVADAPAIIHDLATVFPASPGHFIVGPMVKLGWGTPTLITADLGIVIELPGPRIAVLGVVRMQLPRPDFALLSLQMAVGGILDFPAKQFSLDASLYDSRVVGYPVSGDMAFRLDFGSKPNFLLSVGGFNSGFDAPAGVPTLRRAAIDLGVNGNPSLVASGYFALTSNTAQIGASIELNARGGGIRLHGWLGFDVLFVFSPFSFTASISAGVRVSFHGAGIGITLRGSLSGPSPWHLKGKVCVSVLWWDACLGIDETFGSSRPASLPEMDPWLGQFDPDPRLTVEGLQSAIQDPRNWSGGATAALPSVVTLAAAPADTPPPIDPSGAATLRQRVAPLEQQLEKFGQYAPKDRTLFNRTSVAVGGNPIDSSEITPETDDFAPASFMALTDTDKLSSPPYLPMDAGFSIRSGRVTLGSSGSQSVIYESAYIDAQGRRHPSSPFAISAAQLRGLLGRTGAALAGSRRAGALKYVIPNKPKRIRLAAPVFSIVDACSGRNAASLSPAPLSRVQAMLALRGHVTDNPADRARFQIVPDFAVRP